jgi:hypothetical protein
MRQMLASSEWTGGYLERDINGNVGVLFCIDFIDHDCSISWEISQGLLYGHCMDNLPKYGHFRLTKEGNAIK